MDLYSGRREFLLELLSYEYSIPEKYYQCIKEAIVKNARVHYSAEDLKCLLTMPQSLSAALRLDSINNLATFQQEFSKWINCLEYDIFNTNPNIRFTLLNPDPSTKSPVLHIVDNGDTVVCLPAKPIIYTASPRLFQIPNPLSLEQHQRQELKTPLPEVTDYNSVWSNDDFNQLIKEFLDFAEKGPNTPFTEKREQDNTLSNEDLLASKLSSKESDWAELAMKCRYFSKVGDSYIFTEKEKGLNIPSNMEMIDQINRSLRSSTRTQHSSKPNLTTTNFQKGLNEFACNIQHKMRQSFSNLTGTGKRNYRNNNLPPTNPSNNINQLDESSKNIRH